MAVTITDELEDWSDVRARLKDQLVLLVGNGASRAIWDRFDYPSLFNLACDQSRPQHLSDEDVEIFRHLDDTRNFEQVLSSLLMATKINEVFNLPTGDIIARYHSIRKSLFAAVGDIHVPYHMVNDALKAELRKALAEYRAIFTTNYDLLVYWSYMNEDLPFKDFFWNDDNAFDPGNCDLWDETTTVYYLHGALHLYKQGDGYTKKHVAEDESGSVLDIVRASNEVPLFISEGTWRAKKSAILSNDYLAFAYRMFCQNHRSLVVFGQTLNQEFDNHIVEAIQKMRGWNRSSFSPFPVAISVRPGNSLAIIDLKQRLTAALASKTLYFFDSTTHPLGRSSMKIG